jgi:DASS family divalent anion:Na+ symporter
MVGVVIWLVPVLVPVPTGVSPRAWGLLAIFVATIVGIVVKPLPMGAVAFLGMTATIVTRTLAPAEALSGFSDSTIWLIVTAFFLARGFMTTGLGSRIAYLFVAMLGRRTLGLSYGLVATDLVLAPAIPSNTARSGGVVFPIVASLAAALGSRPSDGTAHALGAFLMVTAYQGAMITSAMFLTGTTGNLVAMRFAAEQGVAITWGTWALAAVLPGVLSLILMPLLVYWLLPPTATETPGAAALAHQKLVSMGAMTRDEWAMLVVFVLLLTLWIFGSRLGGIEPATAALLGLSLLLLIGVLSWQDILAEQGAWDTLVWFAVLVGMANYLNKLGLIPWFSHAVGDHLPGSGWEMRFLVLSLVYFYSHYLFASSTAHATAMYGAFLAVALTIGTPPVFAALVLAFFNGLMGGTTHYGGGPAPVFFGAGYVTVGDWWRVGGLVSVLNIGIWVVVGGLWWKVLGLW